MPIKSPWTDKVCSRLTNLLTCFLSQLLCTCVLRLLSLQLGALDLCCRISFPPAASQPTLCGCLESLSQAPALSSTQPGHRDFQFRFYVADPFVSSPHFKLNAARTGLLASPVLFSVSTNGETIHSESSESNLIHLTRTTFTDQVVNKLQIYPAFSTRLLGSRQHLC